MAPTSGLLDDGLEGAFAGLDGSHPTICKEIPMSHHQSHFAPQTQKPTAPSSSSTYQRGDVTVADSDVAKLAFSKFEARGRAHGFDKEDWANASRELGAKGHAGNHPASLNSAR
jgi:hypothetical protein